MTKNIAIIPARSGSKGLPHKNIKELCGKPLMAYSIEAAIKSGKFDEVMVSTDSAEYADIAVKYGANVPFLRSEKMSGDTASSWDTVKEVLENYKGLGKEFDNVCLLQPTSPLRDCDDIIGAFEVFEKEAKVACVSVCEVEHSPKWCNVLDENKSLDGFIEKNGANQRQKLDKYYRLNGAIYIVAVDELYKDDFLYREGSVAYIMSNEHSVDIDAELDFMIAETIMKNL